MALANYSDLQAAVGAWLAREDLTDRIPDFITLAESQIKRRLRNWTVLKSDFVIDAEKVDLPADCAELRSIRLVTGFASLDTAVNITTPEQLADHRAAVANVPGRPYYAAVVGTQLIVAPTPDSSYTAELVYYSKLTPLSDAAPVNTVLTDAPDLYLFGALKEAEPYLEHDERIPVWTAKFETALNELDIQRERREYGASFRPVRLPTVF